MSKALQRQKALSDIQNFIVTEIFHTSVGAKGAFVVTVFATGTAIHSQLNNFCLVLPRLIPQRLDSGTKY